MNPPSSPKTPPKVRQLGKQWLALIDSIHSQEELNATHIERVMGVTLKEDPEMPGGFILPRRQFTDVWWFTMDLFPRRAQKNDLSVKFLADPRKLTGDYAPMAEVCLDLGKFHQALLKMGYTQDEMRIYDELEVWYRRDKVYLAVFTSSASIDENDHLCVRTVEIRTN